MSSIDVSAASILRKAVEVYDSAQAYGVKIPKHISVKFRNRLASPDYRDILATSEIDAQKLGYLLGNRHRWNQELCKYFTLHFLQFFLQRTPKSKFEPDLLTSQYEESRFEDWASLFAYEPSKYSKSFVMFGPSLFLNNNRYITIKIKTMFPNVSKGPGESQLRWINMRYMKDLNTGNVQLQELPKFEARRVLKDGSLETRGQIRGLEGDVANFSYCQVANAFKEVCHIALRLLVDSPVSSADFSGVSVPFDLLNLIIKKNYKFRLVTYKSVSGGLSSDSKGSIKVNREYRVNGDSDIFFIFGSESDISDILERGIVHSAYTGEGFHLSSHNLYADVPEGEEVCGLVFRTDSPGDIETADMAFWEDGVLVDSWEILSEDQIVDLFGV